MNYTLTEKDGGIYELIIKTDGQWGTICFGWEKTNTEFTTALDSKGLETFVQLLVDDPNTAYNLFCS
jgi:hypothetical protein